MPQSRASATLAEEVAALLRRAISDGGYRSGDRLTELGIAHELGVSQATVRDALRLLEREGWVIKRPRAGSVVRDFTPTEGAEVYALLAALGALALQWAMANLTADAIAELRDLLRTAAVHVESGALTAVSAALDRLHRQLSALAAHPQTARLLDELRNQTSILDALREAHDPRTAAEQMERVRRHERILDALAVGDLLTATSLLHKELDLEVSLIIPLLTNEVRSKK